MNIPAETLIVPPDKSYSSPQCTSLPRPCERTWLAVSNTRLTLRLKPLQTLDPPGKVTKSHHNDGGLGSFTHSHMKREAEKEGSLTSTARAGQTKGRGAALPRDKIIRHWRTGNLPNWPLSASEMRIPLSLRGEKVAEGAKRRRMGRAQPLFGAQFGIFRPGKRVAKLGKRRTGKRLSEASSLILKLGERQQLITIKQS